MQLHTAILSFILLLPLAMQAQTQEAPGAGQSPFRGSVVGGQASAETLPLTLLDAIDRGLKYNFGLVLSDQGIRAAQAERLRALAGLLPNVSARAVDSLQQTNLAAFGFPLQPGMHPIVGPFNVVDVRAAASVPLVDVASHRHLQAARESLKAAEHSGREARENVVLVVTALYLEAVADKSRVEAATAQRDTAAQVLEQARNLKEAGVVAGIDVLRADVQFRAADQRALVAENVFAKAKLNVARAIGLPLAQPFDLADPMPEKPTAPTTIERVLSRAYHDRPDFQRAEALLRSAQATRRAAGAERLPVLRLDGDYGVIGRTPAQTHGTFTAAASLRVPLFTGGRIEAARTLADIRVEQREAELNELRGRIDAEVRAAFLDVTAAEKRVEVARGALDLADRQLVQARDRYAAGVAGSLEVVQAQGDVAAARENFIGALYAFNVARAMLAKSAGIAEQAVKDFLGAK